MLNRLRTYFSRMFEPYLYTPEGFRLAKRKYVVPQDTANLPGGEKRTITVCNLFSNQHKSIDEIARVLDTNRRAVIAGLIHEGLIIDRRGLKRTQKFERRQTAKYHLPLVLPTGQTEEFRALCGQFGSETVSEFVFNEVLKREERLRRVPKEIRGWKVGSDGQLAKQKLKQIGWQELKQGSTPSIPVSATNISVPESQLQTAPKFQLKGVGLFS